MANDTRPYSSPNFPKEEKKEEKKKDRSQETRPYSSPNFKKEETNKTETPVITGHTTPPYSSPNYTQPSQQQNNTSAASSQSQNQTQNRGNNIFNLNTPAAKQAQANATFINNLNPTNVFNMNPVNVFNNSETSQVFNEPTNINRVKKNLNVTTRPYSSPNYKKELYKSIQTQQEGNKPTKLDEAVDNENYWRNNRKQSVSYATSVDYYRMDREGYDTVYVEDGNTALKDKAGVLTIGRDRLEGLPRNVKTVLVDRDGNWKYLVDTTTRAEHAEALQNKLDAVSSIYEYTAGKELKLSSDAEKQRDVLYNRIIQIYQKTADKNKTPENLRRLQASINALEAYNKVLDDSKTRLTEASLKWAKDYDFYNTALNAHTQWTVEEEAQYQQLLSQMSHVYTSPEQVAANAALFTQFAALNKRREANKSCAAYLNTDTLNKFKGMESAMTDAVDAYNKWDSVTIHMEEGEDLGTQIKRAIAITLGYEPENDASTNITNAAKAFIPGVNIYNLYERSKDDKYWDEVTEVTKGTLDATKKVFSPVAIAYQDYIKAADAYHNVQKRIAEGDYKTQDELNDLYAKRLDYLKASDNAITQGKNTILNNAVSNLSVFDTFSVQSTFVAWRMAKHPERYSDDPKFQKMKEAFKAIYGTDFNGAMDAGKMAQAMLNIKLGKTNQDYIYLDGSNLRKRNGENYGFWGSLAVGMLTDVSALTGIAKGLAGVATRKLGARAVAEAATDSLTQSLVRAGITDDVAREFASSSVVQKSLYKDLQKAIKKSMRENGDDLAKTIKDTIVERTKLLDDFAINDFKRLITQSQYDDFIKHADELINSSTDITKTALQVKKGTVLTHALGTLDDTLNDVQSALFKATCPAAGAVVSIANISKAVKNAKNLKLADEDLLHRIVDTAMQAKARIDGLSFSNVLNGTDFRQQWQDIMDEFYYGVAGKTDEITQRFKARPELAGNTYEEIVKPFSECSDFIMRDAANSYTYHVINKLDAALDTHVTGTDRFAELTKLAQESGYDTFDDMLAVIDDNIKIIYDASPDAKHIVDAFKRKYNDAVLKNSIDNIKLYVGNTEKHLDDIRSLLNTNGTSIISKVNATINPAFVQGNAKTAMDNIFDFLQTVNNDYTTFTDDLGRLMSIHEAGTEVINALDNVRLGDLSDLSLMRANDALTEYLDEMDNIYLKQLKDWEANTIQDALGVQGYLKEIQTIVPNHAGNTELQNQIADSMQKFFEEKGINISTQEIFDNILKENPNEFIQLSTAQQSSLIYRVMENKGSSTIGQITDDNLKVLTDGLTDCNAQLNKNLRLIQMNLPENSEAYQYISNAISNACATENTRLLYTYLKASNVDSTLQMTIMDVLAGSSNKINSIVQMYPPEIAATKLTDFILDEAKKQLSLHNGEYSLFTHLNCNTVDVGANVLNIEDVINNGEYAKLFPQDDSCIDICISMNRSTDNSAPKDVAFHIRGSADAPTVLRKRGNFTVYDDAFARRAYGSTAQQLNDGYAALGTLDTLSDDEWIKQFQDYINTVKQQALEQNKTIRFIGFNTSDAVSGGNKFISDVLRSTGVNVNTANAIDFADVIRAANNQFVFDSADISALTRGLRTVTDMANSKSIALGVRNIIAYDPKYTCADMLQQALKNHKFDTDVLNTQAQYILDSAKTVTKGLGTEAYNDIGLAMGTYINANAFAKVLDDAGLSSVHANGDLMKIITNATVTGESQLGLHKIIETAMDDVWLDRSKFTKSFAIKDFNTMERMHDSVLQINRINESIHRLDLITDADLPGLQRIYKDALYKSGLKYRNSYLYSVARAIKVDSLDAQQLYSATKWILDNLQDVMDPKKYDELFSIMLITSKEQATKLTDMGYKFIRDNIVDYTNDSIDAFFVKFLDTSEDGYKFAQALDELAALKKSTQNVKTYMDAVEGLFNRYEIHGIQDRMVLYQLADVHMPIMDLHDEMRQIYDVAYYKTLDDLAEEAKMYSTKNVKGTYDYAMMKRVATERGVRAAKQHIMELGDTARSQSVQVVANLDAEAFRAHLIRNCCGGLIIDPTSKVVKDIDLLTLFEQWRGYGITIDAIDFSEGAIKNKKLFRVYIDDLGEKNADEIFAKYSNTNITFNNYTTRKYSQHVRKGGVNHIRHSSFDASDMTLMNANHVDAFRDLFFKKYGDKDLSKNILDLNTNFQPWANELYSCNMWADMELKQLVNPYYTDNMLNNLAQTTHQLRNNITAVHDLGTIVNNRYMNTKHILRSSGVLQPGSVAEQRKVITKQLLDSKQRLCKISLDSANRFKVVDYTPRLLKKNTSDEFFDAILSNTVLLDEGMVEQLSDWSKATSIALKMQASNAPEWLGYAYNLYKKTIRSATVTMYLYGNLGTAVRNYVDSSTKGAAEVLQYNGDMLTYLKKYKDAVSDVHEYSNIYRQIEENLGTVNHETVAKFFENNPEGLSKFNILYGYEHTCGDSLLQDLSIKEARSKNVDYIQEGLNIDRDTAEQVRKSFDNVYGSSKYYGMTSAQLEKHMAEIHDKCKEAVSKNINRKKYSDADIDLIMEKFWDYHPTTFSWGDKMSQFPVLGFNKARFNNAEVRARLAIYQTFLENGASELDALKHVTATQFDYAGLGKVEDFMPFTQYKLYNALYWFDHANARAVSTAWRAAQYNGDGSMTNQEISDMIAKYRQKSYYIYDAGMDAAYDDYFQNTLEPTIESIFDSDGYLGVPRETGTGNLDINGTHYLKLGNSFIEELNMVTTCMASAAIFASTMKAGIQQEGDTADKIRWAYQSLKYTPLYDSFYSPWKSYADLVTYTYDHYQMIAQHRGEKVDKNYRITSKDVWDCYHLYFGDKDTRSIALSGIPVAGAVLSNMAGRWKSFNLNAGLIAAASIDPDSREELFTYMRDFICDAAGMFIPSVVGTKVDVEKNTYDYYKDTLNKVLRNNPGTYFDIVARLQRSDMGFTEDQAKEIMGSLIYNSPHSELSSFIWLGDRSTRNYYSLISDLYGQGYSVDEIVTMFKQHKLPEQEIDRFKVMSFALPAYLKYDKERRTEIIAYYKAMGMSSEAAWAKLINNPAVIENGRVRELTPTEVWNLNNIQQKTYEAISKRDWLTDEEFEAYWKNMAFRYPKGKWSETYRYLVNAGYSAEDARKMLLKGYMLDENGMLVDAVGKVRARTYSYNTLKGAEWDAYWNSLPDYTKYEKGAFGRTMKALKKQGYSDADARALIQQGIYVDKNGNMMNVTGMERPVLGFPNFSAYYNSIPEYCRYEKGAFSRTYKALKALGFDYDTSLMLIQQGAYLMDMSLAGSLVQTLGARRNKNGSDIAVTDINSLLARYGGQIIMGADGKQYMLIDCSGLTRPRRTFSYARGGRSYGGRGYGSRSYGRRSYGSRGPKLSNYKLRSPFVINGNVSTYTGFTNYRGSYKLQKPYTTKGYVSTFSTQNFLNGASYGMRKTYKIDMRQFKSGALSTKSAYPTSYRNIAVAYRRNMYKDLYAKYGMSRMRMRANKQGYSNAAITRLRRNEIANRERYAERRDQITKLNITKKKASS